MRRVALLTLALFLAPLAATPLAAQSDWPRTVLITNDDGIDAPGLLALVRAFAPVAKTYVVAPLENRSGSTNYISAIATRSLEVEPRSLGAGVVAYAVDGFPADAVALALGGLLRDGPPDLVISGVNTGPNLTGAWNVSGTIGAAQFAAFSGVPAIAVSGYKADDPETLAAIARWVVELAGSPIVRGLEPGRYLTVSIPRVPASEIDGAEVVRRAPSTWTLAFERSADASGDRELWSLRFRPQQVTPPEGTDLHAYNAHRIAIVPMRADEHDAKLFKKLLESAADLPSWPGIDGSR